MAPYNYKFAFAVVFLVFAGSAFCDDPKPGMWQERTLTCFICDDLTDCEKSVDELVNTKCKPDDPCVTIFDNDGKVIKRACDSDLTNTECKDKDKCFKCVSNKCNKATTKNDFVECLSCDSSEDPKCVADLTGIKTRMCYKECMVALYRKDKTDEKAGYGLVRSCLDDKETEDQSKCGNEDKNCKSCNGADPKCNNIMLPADRLSCFQCKGASCADSGQKSTPCPTYKKVDTCVFIFDDEMKFTEAQCKSSLKEDQVKELETAGKLYSCLGDNCDPKNPPSAPQCLKCDSTEECASNPNKLDTFTPCGFNYCFSQILDNGKTQRGCFKDLIPSVQGNCKEDNTESCAQCKGDKCNKQIYPKNRRQCYKCNSENDANCEGNPQGPIVCPIYKQGNKESCATKFNTETKVTTRGCQSELNCNKDDPNCEICENQSSCNNINLKEKNSNNPKPGMWQEGPLKCLTCDGLTDCQKPIGEIGDKKCQPNDPCVTIFDNDGKVIKRACDSDLTNTECKDKDKCFKCVSNKCNKATTKNDFVECLSCDSSEDPKCVADLTGIKTRMCYKECMVALYRKDKTDEKAGYGLVRSCLDDKETDDQAKCRKEDKNCKSCNGADPKCNNIMLPADRLSCFQCKGESCADTGQKSTPCPTYKEGDTCVFIFNDEMKFTEAQCKSSLKEDQVKELETSGKLYSCPGDNCDPKNPPSAPQCLKCDSTEECASNPNKLNTFTPCNFNYCFSRILDDGKTKRGCFKDLIPSVQGNCKEGNEEGCAQCKGDKCNNKIYPKNRRQCYKCNSENDGNCEGNPQTPVICPNYKPGNGESCVTKFNTETKVTTRGCQSEFPCTGRNKNKCLECKSKDSCNIINLKQANSNDAEPGRFQHLPLTCIKCNSEAECKTSIVDDTCRVDTDQCVTVFNTEGTVIKRGCASSTTSDCAREDTDCLKCWSKKCNRANDKSKYKKCLSCDTKTNQKCLSDANSITSIRYCYEHCMVALYPKDNNPNPSYELVRSCLDDKEEDDRNKCDSSEISCKKCNDDNCNNFMYPDKRLKCYQCQGEGCNSEVTSNYCPSFKKDDACVFVFDKNNVFFAADCKSSLPNSQVEELEKAGKLFSCTEDNCNSLEITPKMPSCLQCDSSENENCATNPETLGTTTTCNFKYCYSQILANGDTKRGCFSNLDPTLQGSCTEASSGLCTQCKGDNCNKQIYPSNRKKCHRCISTKDEKCAAEPNKPEVCPKYVADDSCVTHFEKEKKVTKRGCFSEYPCDGKDEKQCQTCKDGDSCNTVDLEKANGAMGIYLTVGALLATLCHLVL